MHLGDVIVLLAVATLGLVGGRAVGLPPIAGYLVAGVLAGPGVLGLVAHSEGVEQLSELGVALLLFGVGIEFSLGRLRRALARILAAGGLQVGLTTAGVALVLRATGTTWSGAVFIGFLVALSSTAVVLKVFADEGEIDAPHAQAAAGVLLFQDLALVPMVLFVPVLARPAEGVATAAALALARSLVAVAGVLVLARAALPRILQQVARVRTPELFPLAALVLAFGTALGASALGLSLPIGTFLAGLALSGSPYAHQVFAEVLPLRDAFVAVFFTSIGMLLAPGVALWSAAGLSAGMAALVLVKGALAAAIVAAVWGSLRLGIAVGLALAQIGEFSFVLSRVGAAEGLLPGRYEQAFLAAAILTMAATPALMRIGRRLAALDTTGPPVPRTPVLRDHVLVLGHGTTGSAVARVLRETGIRFVAVDMMPEAVESARAAGIEVRFGDVSRRGVLERLDAPHARAAVVTVGSPDATRRAVSLLRQLNPTMRILVRARRVDEIEELERLGADEVVPSEFEVSVELFVRLLTHLGVPRHVVRIQESLIRMDRYQALRGVGMTAELLQRAGRIVAGGILENARVMEGSEACGRTLGELELRKRTGATVLGVVRNEVPIEQIDGTTRLEAGDLIVLFGPHEAIDRALRIVEPRGEVREA